MRTLLAVVIFFVLGALVVSTLQLQDTREWDRGEGRPSAVTLKPGDVRLAPASVNYLTSRWKECNHNCHQGSVRRHPTIYNFAVDDLEQGCYLLKVLNRVPVISVATKKDGALYTAAFTTNAAQVRLCLRDGRPAEGIVSHNFFVIWSDKSTVD